jgi:hypothetical protein
MDSLDCGVSAWIRCQMNYKLVWGFFGAEIHLMTSYIRQLHSEKVDQEEVFYYKDPITQILHTLQIIFGVSGTLMKRALTTKYTYFTFVYCSIFLSFINNFQITQ